STTLFARNDHTSWKLKASEWHEQAAFHIESLSARQLESLSSSFYLTYPESRFVVFNRSKQRPEWTYPDSRTIGVPKELHSAFDFGRYQLSIQTPFRSVFESSLRFLLIYIGMSFCFAIGVREFESI